MISDEFYRKQETRELHWERRPAKEETVNPNSIIMDKDWNPEAPEFWKHHGRSKDDCMDYVRSGQADNSKPLEVNKYEDKYILVNDGSHRVAASQELNRPIKVNVTGEYVEQSQNVDQNNEEEMSI